MNDCHPARTHRISRRDRQMLAAAYWPVIAFAVVLIGARFTGIRSHQPEAVAR
jgi:hypothetical protein